MRPDDETPRDWAVPVGPPPPRRYLDACYADMRLRLGLPALPDMADLDGLPDDMRAFVEREL